MRECRDRRVGPSEKIDKGGHLCGVAPRARPRLQVAGQMSIFDPGGNSACTTRTDGFSAASERTAFASRPPVHGTDGARQTSTPTVSKTNTYDTANRIRNTGYTYDDLGRTVTTPAAEPASGANACLAPRTSLTT